MASFWDKTKNKPWAHGGDFEVVLQCFEEELGEFGTALGAYLNQPSKTNREEMIKEWADVQYTLSVFPWFFSFNGEAAFNRVADNNDTKLIDGEIRYREDGKVLKPDGYVKASMAGL